MASFRDSYASMLRFASSKNCAGRLQGLLMTLLIVLLSLFAFLLYPTWLLNLASGQALAAVYSESAVTFAIDPSSIYYQGMKPLFATFSWLSLVVGAIDIMAGLTGWLVGKTKGRR